MLDGLRFVAALSVVAYHFTTMDHVWHRRAADLFPHQTAAYGWLGVYLFFLISGFVIGMSSWGRGVGSFLRSRAVRLYPAYWLSVLVITVVVSLWPYSQRPVGWRDLLVNLTMFQDSVGVPPVSEVYWTLWAELRFYLLFSLVVWCGLSYRRVAGFCALWLGTVAVVRVVLPGGSLVHAVLMTDYAPLFTGGLAAYLMYRFRPTLTTWGILAGSLLLAVPTAVYRDGLEATAVDAAPPKWGAVALLALCFLVIVAVALGWLRWVRGRWLVVIGATTYPLYLLHLNLGGLLLYRWQHSVPPALLVTAVAALMIILAWLVHRFVERPVGPLLKRALLRVFRHPEGDGPDGRQGGRPRPARRGPRRLAPDPAHPGRHPARRHPRWRSPQPCAPEGNESAWEPAALLDP